MEQSREGLQFRVSASSAYVCIAVSGYFSVMALLKLFLFVVCLRVGLLGINIAVKWFDPVDAISTDRILVGSRDGS